MRSRRRRRVTCTSQADAPAPHGISPLTARDERRQRLTEVIARSADETRAFGRSLGTAAAAGDILLLQGTLGAGKTIVVQGLAAGLGCAGEVTSPTFVLVHHYPGRLELVHADLYRLRDRHEIEALGLLELSADGVLALEWADRAPWLSAPMAARLAIDTGDGELDRRLRLSGGPARLHQALSRGDTSMP